MLTEGGDRETDRQERRKAEHYTKQQEVKS